MVKGLKNKSYEERLQALMITSLEKRRIRGYLIQFFRIVRSFDRVEFDELFELDDGGGHVRRGNYWKLKVKRCRLQVTKCFFTRGLLMCGTSCRSMSWSLFPSSCSRKDWIIGFGAWISNYKLCLHPLPVTTFKLTYKLQVFYVTR